MKIQLLFILIGNILITKSLSSAIILDFEGPPIQPPHTQYGISHYIEDGYITKPLGPIATTPPYRLTRNGGGISAYPNNGGSFLQLLILSSLELYNLNGDPFTLISIDLAEYSTVFHSVRLVGFEGTKFDGSTLNTNFRLDGRIDGSGPGVDF